VDVVNATASESRRLASGSVAFGTSEGLHAQYGSSIRVRILRDDSKRAVLVLRGELDITSMGPFEQALHSVLADSPTGLIFDLTACEFVSAQGYAAMGCCSLTMPVEVRSRTNIARRVFATYGHHRVTVVTTEESLEGLA
jgi:hypothetical protein